MTNAATPAQKAALQSIAATGGTKASTNVVRALRLAGLIEIPPTGASWQLTAAGYNALGALLAP